MQSPLAVAGRARFASYVVCAALFACLLVAMGSGTYIYLRIRAARHVLAGVQELQTSHQAAVQTLGGEGRAIDSLALYLEWAEPDADERSVVYAVLGHCGPKATMLIERGLQDKNRSVRCAALKALVELGCNMRDFVPFASTLLLDDDPGIRLLGAEACVSAGVYDSRVAEVLVGILDNAEYSLRVSQCLRNAGPKGLGTLSRAILSDNPVTRKNALEVCRLIKAPFNCVRGSLLEALGSPDWATRVRAIWAITESHPRGGAEAIRALLGTVRDDDHERVRVEAIEALGQLGAMCPAEAVTVLGGLAQSPVEHEFVRQAAREALEKIKKAQEKAKEEQPVETPAK